MILIILCLTNFQNLILALGLSNDRVNVGGMLKKSVPNTSQSKNFIQF